MTDAAQTEWLTVPDLMQVLDERQSRVRTLINDRHLIGKRIDGVFKVPAVFVREGAPVGELHGTAVLLADIGFSGDEAVDWMLDLEESLGVAPIEALRAGRKAEVRRVAQALA